MLGQGIKLVGIFKPRIVLRNPNGELTAAAKYAYDHKFFFEWEQPYEEYFSKRPALDIDFSKPAARAWLWEHMIPAYRSGIQYFWNDEADSIGNTFFPNYQHANMQRAMYEGARSLGNQRVWSISRNFYLGAQRYAYGEWSGDERTGFSSMAWQAPRMLSTVQTTSRVDGRELAAIDRLLLRQALAQSFLRDGAMLEMVARSGMVRLATPSPKNSTNLPTTLCRRSISVTCRTRSVDVTPGRRAPVTFTPTTRG